MQLIRESRRPSSPEPSSPDGGRGAALAALTGVVALRLAGCDELTCTTSRATSRGAEHFFADGQSSPAAGRRATVRAGAARRSDDIRAVVRPGHEAANAADDVPVRDHQGRPRARQAAVRHLLRRLPRRDRRRQRHDRAARVRPAAVSFARAARSNGRSPAGHFFNVITNGWGAMYSYNDRIVPRRPLADRRVRARAAAEPARRGRSAAADDRGKRQTAEEATPGAARRAAPATVAAAPEPPTASDGHRKRRRDRQGQPEGVSAIAATSAVTSPTTTPTGHADATPDGWHGASTASSGPR